MDNTHARNQIINYVIAGIENNVFPPGERLPSQRNMGNQFGVDKMTVRDAMKVLEDRGFVTIKSGSGAYVNTLASLHFKYEKEPTEQAVEIHHIGDCLRMVKLESIRCIVKNGTQKEINSLSKIIQDYHKKLSSNTPLKERYLHDVSFSLKIVEYSHNPIFQMLFAELIDHVSEAITLSCTDYDIHKKIVELDLCLCEALNDRDIERATWLIRERGYMLGTLRTKMKQTVTKKYKLTTIPQV